MKKAAVILFATLILFSFSFIPLAEAASIKLGSDQLMGTYHYLIEGKKVGLVTNQSGVNGAGVSTLTLLAQDKSVQLAALYGPEHGIDGTAQAGAYVKSYVHPTLKIPVYSLYGDTRMPTKEMLSNVDVLVFDVQDIGARSYTYMSTLNYCMVAARKYQKPIIVLDRPNPLGGDIVEGPVLEERFKSFVGVDNIPMAHGMTAGELAKFFNRKIGADLTVVPMEGYTRSMRFQDTGLPWVQTSPNIPDLDSVFGYMATGLGEGTGIFQADKFKWVGGKGIDSQQFASLLNGAGLPGVVFLPEPQGSAGGVRLQITDYQTFNPARTGMYVLAYAHSLNGFKVPKSGQQVVMFDKIMGTDKIGRYLEQGLSPQQIEANYTTDLEKFKLEREKYLIYGDQAEQAPLPEQSAPAQPLPEKPVNSQSPPSDGSIQVIVDGNPVVFDVAPYIDTKGRLMVPLRAIVESLNASVAWDGRSKIITIERLDKRSIFTIGSSRALFSGAVVTMDTCPVIKNGRTMVPARFVAQSVGAEVNWNQNTQTISIRSDGGPKE